MAKQFWLCPSQEGKGREKHKEHLFGPCAKFHQGYVVPIKISCSKKWIQGSFEMMGASLAEVHQELLIALSPGPSPRGEGQC